ENVIALPLGRASSIFLMCSFSSKRWASSWEFQARIADPSDGDVRDNSSGVQPAQYDHGANRYFIAVEAHLDAKSGPLICVHSVQPLFRTLDLLLIGRGPCF